MNLTPRGFGRTAYKIAECIQMGLVPVYVYDAREWLPYRGSKAADFTRFGYVFSAAEIAEIATLAHRVSDEELDQKRLELLQLRESHFTAEGTLEQIIRWLQDAASSDLSCVPHPKCPTVDGPCWYMPIKHPATCWIGEH